MCQLSSSPETLATFFCSSLSFTRGSPIISGMQKLTTPTFQLPTSHPSKHLTFCSDWWMHLQVTHVNLLNYAPKFFYSPWVAPASTAPPGYAHGINCPNSIPSQLPSQLGGIRVRYRKGPGWTGLDTNNLFLLNCRRERQTNPNPNQP